MATLTACAQTSVITNKSNLSAVSPQMSPEEKRNASLATNRRAAVKSERDTAIAVPGHAVEQHVTPYGLASFYKDDALTASGERFDPKKLTAAHRTLPFGTRLRVTNITTGRSVMVRVNDRGPFIPGRVIDVSYAAAETLGIVGRGVAKVKLRVVQ
jgi:rare lipoprotein A